MSDQSPPDTKKISRDVPIKSEGRKVVYETSAAVTPEAWAGIVTAADEGDTDDYFAMLKRVESRDLFIGGILSTRKNALAGRRWSLSPASEDPTDVEIAATLERKLIRGKLWLPLVTALMDAHFRGRSTVEIRWSFSESEWMPRAFPWRDPRHFVVDEEDGQTLRLREGDGAVDLAFGKWITHTPSDQTGNMWDLGFGRAISAAYVAKTFGLGAWLTYCELYGVPFRAGMYPPELSSDERDAFMESIEALGTDAAAMFPLGTELTLVSPSGGAADVHPSLVRFLDRQCAIRILGQSLLTDPGDRGSFALGKVLDGVRRDILRGDANGIVSTLQEALIEPVVMLNYGDREPPTLEVSTDDPPELKEWTSAVVQFADRGLRVPTSAVYRRLQIEGPKDGEDVEVLQPLQRGSVRVSTAGRAALAESERPGYVDELIGESDREFIGDAIAGAASSSASFADLEDALHGYIDGDPLIRSIATAALKSRGLGDAKDDPSL